MIFLSINHNVATFGYVANECYSIYRRRIDSIGVDSRFMINYPSIRAITTISSGTCYRIPRENVHA